MLNDGYVYLIEHESKAHCYLLIGIPNVQECDATGAKLKYKVGFITIKKIVSERV